MTNRFATPMKLFDKVLQHSNLVFLLVECPDEFFHPGLQLVYTGGGKVSSGLTVEGGRTVTHVLSMLHSSSAQVLLC